MIAIDLDGTLLNYGDVARATTTANRALLQSLCSTANILRQSGIAIVTNQGGLPFAIKQQRTQQRVTFPTIKEFALRIEYAWRSLADVGLRLNALRICVYHPNATPDDIEIAARQLRNLLPSFLPVAMPATTWHVYATAAMRKPAGGMLRTLHPPGLYYGDSDDDRQAAEAAGWQFVSVPRYR